MKCHLSSFLNVPPHCQREFVFKRIWNLIGRAEPFETPSNMICHFHICQFPSSRSSCCELNATSPFASSASRVKIKLVGYTKHYMARTFYTGVPNNNPPPSFCPQKVPLPFFRRSHSVQRIGKVWVWNKNGMGGYFRGHPCIKEKTRVTQI